MIQIFCQQILNNNVKTKIIEVIILSLSVEDLESIIKEIILNII